MGFLNFNRRFVAGFSKKALPLTRLTTKDTEFNWGKEQDDAVKQLKEACMNPPVLVTFQTNQPAKIETDASDLAIGACLYQQKEDKWHPVAYYSRKITAPEQNYDIHDKELLAVVESLKH